MWRFTLLAGAVVALGLTFTPVRAADDNANSPAAQSGKLNKDDLKFVKAAATGGEIEVALGKLAADKATNADVKAFGQKMADDHGKANDELTKLAQSKGYDLAAEKDKRQKKVDKKVDDLIAIVAAAQEPDGYLYTPRSVDPANPAPGAGPERW